MVRFFLLAGLLAVPAWAAHAAPGAAAPDPLDARAPLPRPAAVAPAPARRPVDDPEPLGWRAANERVARIGGWRAYAREAAAPASAPEGAAR